jgi:syringomycin synthetase protein SyrE
LGQDQEIAFLGLLGAAPLVTEATGALPCSRALPGWSIESVSGRIVRLDLLASGVVPRTVTLARRYDGEPKGLQDLWSDALNLADSEAMHRAPELDYQPLIKLQTGHSAHVPLFCVPGAGDSVMGLRDWGAALGVEWPVYGVQPRGTDGVLLPHSTVEAAAAMALRAIESIAGAGPVHLAGHSFGGWVAFEIAQRWRALGREVLSLTLLDSEAPNAAGVLDKEQSHLDVCEQLAASLELASGRPIGLFRHQLAPLSPAQRLATVHAAMTRHGLLPKRTRPEVMEGPLQAFGSALRACYRPASVWESPVQLIQADDPRHSAARNAKDQQQEYERWLLWAPRLRRWKGPGNHMSMLKPPHVRSCVDWYLAQDHGGGPTVKAEALPMKTSDKGINE